MWEIFGLVFFGDSQRLVDAPNKTFRLDDINFGYTFNKLGHWANANLRLGFTVQNVFVITGYSGLDPEIGGIDNSMWPRPRTFSLRANLNF